MRDEYWQLMEVILPVLQPLQVVTELLSSETMPPSSVVYPMLQKLVTVDLKENSGDSTVVRSFKADLGRCIDEWFGLSDVATSSHLFVTATVLDPVTKAMDHFPDDFRTAAYEHVLTLPRPATPGQNPTDSTASSSSTDDDQPPAKRAKMDSQAASLRFLAKSAPQPLHQSDFE